MSPHTTKDGKRFVFLLRNHFQMFEKLKQRLTPHKKGKPTTSNHLSTSRAESPSTPNGSLTDKYLDDVPSTSSLPSAPMQIQQSRINKVLAVSKGMLRAMEVILGAPAIGAFLEVVESQEPKPTSILTREDLQVYCCYLMDSIEKSMDRDRSKTAPKLQISLNRLHSMLSGIRREMLDGDDNSISVDEITRRITQAVDSFMLLNSISGIIAVTGQHNSGNDQALSRLIRELLHVEAAHDDSESKKRNSLCFNGTREALLQDIANWVSALHIVQIFLLSGIAGAGKSTVAFTVAERAKQSGYLGASFFFSRDVAERSNAKKFFLTLAYQLCLYDKEFAQAIDKALCAERGIAAIAKDPREQLEALILEPLRDIVKSRSSPIVVVVDALDECDNQDGTVVLTSLLHLVHELPHFKIFLTTRPQSHLPSNLPLSQVFHLQNIEDKIVNHDIMLYLRHRLSSEQVALCMPSLEETWSASDEEIESLVDAAGTLFIMAATVVRFVLDMTIHDPKSQMEELKIDGRITLGSLGKFYGTILRHAVPLGKTTVERRFKIVVGTILVVQEPLPINVLERLAQPCSASAIKGVLANLQSVITVTNDTPRIYHKSFYDFLTDADHCPQDFRIDTRNHHTRVATLCLQIMNRRLKRNILDLGIPARFMPDRDGLAAENITEEQLIEKIPPELRYACIYWANHLEAADPMDIELQHAVETFVDEHLMHWLETLGWIRKLGVAYRAIRVLQKLLSFISPDVDEVVSDALHFVSNFHQVIDGSALHTYYSAIPFTPTARPLFKKYEKELMDNPFRLEGVPAQWGPRIGGIRQGRGEYHLVFSQDSSKFASFSQNQEEMSLWDAEDRAPIRTIKADRVALSDDFAVGALLRSRDVTLWNIESSMPMAHAFEHRAEVLQLALSFDGSRLAVGLSDGTVSLWDGKKGAQIASLKNYSRDGALVKFAPSGYVLAFGMDDGSIQLWDGLNGSLISKLHYESKKHVEFIFTRNSSWLAAVAKDQDRSFRHSLLLWNGQTGKLISSAENVGHRLAVSHDGSFIATGGSSIQMWTGSPLHLVDTLYIGGEISSMAISHDILVAASFVGRTLVIYDINGRNVISKLHPSGADDLALSPDCSRLATGNNFSAVLWDFPKIITSVPAASATAVTALTFSPDCSHLASGLQNGTVELWSTSQTSKPLASHKSHSGAITALAFSIDGERFASASTDTLIRFWSSQGGTIDRDAFYCPCISLAFSSNVLACGALDSISLWESTSLEPIDTLDGGAHSLSFSEDSSLLASARNSYFDHGSEVVVWNVKERTSIATFSVNSRTERLMFSPDGTWLAIQSQHETMGIEFFSVVRKEMITDTEHRDLSWIPNIHGIPMLLKYDMVGMWRLWGRFSDKYDRVPMLWIPSEFNVETFAAGKSIFALGLHNGVILFVRSSTASFD